MNERINAIIKALHLKKTEFAKRLNVSQPFVTQITNGVRIPSDRTIADICREFHVNEEWLRTGNGEMFSQKNRDEEIAEIVNNLLHENSDDFKRRLIYALCQLDSDEWKKIEQFAAFLLDMSD